MRQGPLGRLLRKVACTTCRTTSACRAVLVLASAARVCEVEQLRECVAVIGVKVLDMSCCGRKGGNPSCPRLPCATLMPSRSTSHTIVLKKKTRGSHAANLRWVREMCTFHTLLPRAIHVEHQMMVLYCILRWPNHPAVVRARQWQDVNASTIHFNLHLLFS